ncbi:beta-ketoacyl-ACP synthase III [Cerasicoccus arenae]|uniref:Beta-ketoacyl-[acyl-carrier-protein] synthase III n=1 Tax=Cerasicoccus arenae TaxID=424488 RepID=A0A8J3GDT7_9BACT|nr:beta-ketoacyl-ACP synthase III [Cerasicoccus arenae]GHC04539.1 3-oxoacyl-[acyl-carrier-protein] synthase 3 [Cerasicoccus arenae]
MSATSVLISGLGACIPDKIVTNDEIAELVDTSDEWIRSRSGIAERRVAGEGETASSLGACAARKALADAGVSRDEVDLIIVGTMSPDMPFPSTACLIQAELGLKPIAAFDVVAACSGFLYILEVGLQMMRSGNYRHALIIGAEKMSSILDWQDRSTCVLFGDGAGAALLTRSDLPDCGVGKVIIRADGSKMDLLNMPAGGSQLPASVDTVNTRQHFLKMNGKEIFKHAVREMGDITLEVIEKNGLKPEDIKCFIPHQANIRIIESISKRLGVSMDRFYVNIDRYGNTSAASVPIAMWEARQRGRFGPGDTILLTAFGAGLTWGGAVIRWPK